MIKNLISLVDEKKDESEQQKPLLKRSQNDFTPYRFFTPDVNLHGHGPLVAPLPAQPRRPRVTFTLEQLPMWHPDATKIGKLFDSDSIFVKYFKDGCISLVYEQQLRYRGLHGYTITIVDGHILPSDGVGFVFADRVPCSKNIKRLWSVFANRTGHVVKRMGDHMERELEPQLPPLQIGNSITIVMDLDQYVAVFQSSDSKGNVLARNKVDFASLAERVDASRGYLCAAMTKSGIILRMESAPVQILDEPEIKYIPDMKSKVNHFPTRHRPLKPSHHPYDHVLSRPFINPPVHLEAVGEPWGESEPGVFGNKPMMNGYTHLNQDFSFSNAKYRPFSPCQDRPYVSSLLREKSVNHYYESNQNEPSSMEIHGTRPLNYNIQGSTDLKNSAPTWLRLPPSVSATTYHADVLQGVDKFSCFHTTYQQDMAFNPPHETPHYFHSCASADPQSLEQWLSPLEVSTSNSKEDEGRPRLSFFRGYTPHHMTDVDSFKNRHPHDPKRRDSDCPGECCRRKINGAMVTKTLQSWIHQGLLDKDELCDALMSMSLNETTPLARTKTVTSLPNVSEEIYSVEPNKLFNTMFPNFNSLTVDDRTMSAPPAPIDLLGLNPPADQM